MNSLFGRWMGEEKLVDTLKFQRSKWISNKEVGCGVASCAKWLGSDIDLLKSAGQTFWITGEKGSRSIGEEFSLA